MTFEETLLFTGLDIDLNSFQKDEEINEKSLLEISEINFMEAFTCDRVELHQPIDKLSTHQKLQPKTEKELDQLIDKTLLNYEANGLIWREIKEILFSKELSGS